MCPRPPKLLKQRAMGIEPTPPAWKAGALPLSYARDVRCCLSGCFSVTNASLANKIWGKQDSNLRRRSHQIYSLAHLATLVFPEAAEYTNWVFACKSCGTRNRSSQDPGVQWASGDRGSSPGACRADTRNASGDRIHRGVLDVLGWNGVGRPSKSGRRLPVPPQNSPKWRAAG